MEIPDNMCLQCGLPKPEVSHEELEDFCNDCLKVAPDHVYEAITGVARQNEEDEEGVNSEDEEINQLEIVDDRTPETIVQEAIQYSIETLPQEDREKLYGGDKKKLNQVVMELVENVVDIFGSWYR